ncbi:MAG: sugar ABC transporter ATP-binding protein [Treponema sp.]|jgi:simple sugar transport system ATP-binding protein|nr:sugar ABC transporter ATP-binding protein [Treponema sp.]
MQENTVLTMRKIGKEFPGVRALRDVDFTLRQGEIHALMGENGAGKSTLIKVLTGVYHKDSGEIYIKGIDKAITIKSPQEAQDLGISTVYQEITLCPNLTVAENMFIGRGKYNFVNWGTMRKKAGGILDNLGIPARPTQQLANCSLAVQQMVAIGRAVDMDCKALILDEPTSSLDDNEAAKLFTLMRNLKARGVGIVFVTHFLEQVYEVCDRITVLRNGELVGEYEIKDLPRVELVSRMIGKDIVNFSEISHRETKAADLKSQPVYEAEGLSSDAGVRPFNFQIRKGEVNGFTGLLGSGRSECVRAIFGADRVTGGLVKMNGYKIKVSKPIEAMKNGIGYLPEDRKNDGIIADLSVRDNLILALQVMKGFFQPFTKAQAQAFADEYIKALNIKTASANTPIKSLSGGNQQKVILARWLLTKPKYLILDEPTRGIDISAKIEIQKLVLRFAEDGMSLTFISSEMDELLRICSRLIVMRDRHVAGELSGGNMTRDNIMHTIAGGTDAR